MLAWHVVDADTGDVLLSRSPDVVLPTASVAKVLVLAALARALESGEVAAGEMLSRAVTPPVADSGLWHLISVDALPVEDVAVLVGAVSDNWATNVLVERLGLAAVADARLHATALHDLVRDDRSPDDEPTLSTGTAREWTTVLTALHAGTWVSPGADARVLGWLAAGVDHSMVASAWGLDPLVAGAVVNKTGTDDGVRCDVGLATGPARTAAYACLGGGEDGELVAQMRALGTQVRALTDARGDRG